MDVYDHDNEGVVPGNYRIRLDEVEPNSGEVRARAEVPLNVPSKVAAGPVPAKAAASKQPDNATAQQPLAVLPQTVPQRPPIVSQQLPGGTQQPEAVPHQPPIVTQQPIATAQPTATVSPSSGSSAIVVVPKIETTTVSRGDNL